MQITLTTDQEAFVLQAIKTGRFRRPEDAVTEALLLWEERELLRSEFLASLD
jgi:Arc/MetJ-type ribon-helix-helix transcriptional regulator